MPPTMTSRPITWRLATKKTMNDVVNEGLLFVSVSYGNSQSALNNFVSAVRKPEKGVKCMCVALLLTFCHCECPSPNFSFTDIDIERLQSNISSSHTVDCCLPLVTCQRKEDKRMKAVCLCLALPRLTERWRTENISRLLSPSTTFLPSGQEGWIGLKE